MLHLCNVIIKSKIFSVVNNPCPKLSVSLYVWKFCEGHCYLKQRSTTITRIRMTRFISHTKTYPCLESVRTFYRKGRMIYYDRFAAYTHLSWNHLVQITKYQVNILQSLTTNGEIQTLVPWTLSNRDSLSTPPACHFNMAREVHLLTIQCWGVGKAIHQT